MLTFKRSGLSKLLNRAAMMGVFVFPLNSTPEWHHYTFKNLKANRVIQQKERLRIEVDDSSSPLFYHFAKVQKVTKISLKGKLLGLPETPKGEDDFPLRIGLVSPGEKGLNWFERLVAPPWLKALSELDPHQKVNDVYFYLLTHRPLDFSRRKHPKSDLITEEMSQVISEGPFEVEITVSPPRLAFALWLQSDADDSHSKFTIEVERLQIETED